ncbi:MAG: lpdA, partial [Candidatus Eremiobacteraeota bacterium]|nr:lpdA [Candidatus Eremiobacteraeota bacterium]
MAQIELTVPDLGGFDQIPVIEVLVRPGETIAKDAPLVTLESDKATMEVPASAAGVVKDVRVKIGDKVSQGSVLVTVES